MADHYFGIGTYTGAGQLTLCNAGNNWNAAGGLAGNGSTPPYSLKADFSGKTIYYYNGLGASGDGPHVTTTAVSISGAVAGVSGLFGGSPVDEIGAE